MLFWACLGGLTETKVKKGVNKKKKRRERKPVFFVSPPPPPRCHAKEAMLSPVAPTPAHAVPSALPSPELPHVCTRHCSFAKEFGNVFCCVSTGTLHACDQGCDAQVPVDAHTAVCRLSGREFVRGDGARMR